MLRDVLVDAYFVEPPPSELENLAALAGLTRDELREWLEHEVERRRAAVEQLLPVVDAQARRQRKGHPEVPRFVR